jgi:hypothetical protein
MYVSTQYELNDVLINIGFGKLYHQFIFYLRIITFHFEATYSNTHGCESVSMCVRQLSLFFKSQL